MMSVPTLDKCPGYNLYIGGVISLRRPQALRHCNITHIVSVLDWKFDDDSTPLKGYQHLHIPVDDVADENLLEWFPRSNAFIRQGLEWFPRSDVSIQHGSDLGPYQSRLGTGRVAADPMASQELGSGVLIHCAMGKSRSATVLLAYLLWASRHNRPSPLKPESDVQDREVVPIPSPSLSVIKALELLRQGRAIAEPNEGFMEQLHMYEAMDCPTTDDELKRHKIYRRWLNKRSIEESLRVNQAPELANIRFEDESDSDSELDSHQGEDPKPGPTLFPELVTEKQMYSHTVDSSVTVTNHSLASSALVSNLDLVPPNKTELTTLKCRKCRQLLATTAFIHPHEPPPHKDPNQALATEISSADQPRIANQCAHIFLHPLSWMRSVLSEGTMEGRLSCPNKRCGANIGKFAWTGLRCSCGGWVTPGFGLIRGKVDEITNGSKASGQGNDGVSGPGLRMPPGMIRRGNL